MANKPGARAAPAPVAADPESTSNQPRSESLPRGLPPAARQTASRPFPAGDRRSGSGRGSRSRCSRLLPRGPGADRTGHRTRSRLPPPRGGLLPCRRGEHTIYRAKPARSGGPPPGGPRPPSGCIRPRTHPLFEDPDDPRHSASDRSMTHQTPTIPHLPRCA